MKKVVNNLKINTEILDLSANKNEIKNAVFIKCHFDDITSEIETNKTPLNFFNCTFIDCKFGDCFFFRNTFGKCDFTRCDFWFSRFKDCVFSHANFSDCLYHGRIIFYNCNLHTINVKNLIHGNDFQNYVNDDCKQYAVVQD